MNAARLWTLGSIITIVALLVGTWFVGISPRLNEAAVANTDRETVEAQNGIQQARILSLKKQFEDIDQLRDRLAGLRGAIPDGVALPDFVGELNLLAEQAGVVVTSVGFTDPAGYEPVVDPNADPELLAALSSVSAESFFALPVQVTVSGPYANALSFVNLLQSAKRFVLVHGLTLQTGLMVSDAPVELVVSGQAFVLLDPSDVAAANGATASPAPATGATAPPEPSTTPTAPSTTPAPTETAPTS